MAKKNDKLATENAVKPMEPKPTLMLGEKDLAAIKDWKIGDKHQLMVEVEVTRLSKNEYGLDDSTEMQASAKVLEIKPYKDPEMSGWGDEDEEDE